MLEVNDQGKSHKDAYTWKLYNVFPDTITKSGAPARMLTVSITIGRQAHSTLYWF